MIFRYKVFFRLLYMDNGVLKTAYLPEEPINWDKVDIILERDNVYHGLTCQYTDGDIQLEFAKDCGLEVIELVYSQEGSEGSVILEFGFVEGESFVVEYSGKLNLNSYKKFKGRVSCTLETTGFHELLNTRMDTNVNLFDTKTLDGSEKINKAINVTLHSKRLQRSTIVRNNPYVSESDGLYDSDNIYIMFDFTNKPEIADIQEFLTTGFSVLPYDPSVNPDTKDDLILFKLADGGSLNFKLDIRYLAYIYLQERGGIFVGDPYFSNYRFRVMLKVTDVNGLVTKQNIALADTGVINVNTDFLRTEFVFTTDNTIDVDPNDRIYIYGHLSVDAHNENAVGLQINSLYPEGEGNTIQILNVLGITEQAESEAKGILIHEAVESLVESITGESNSFDSEYFGRIGLGYVFDGLGSKFILSNGFFIRNFRIEDRSLNTTLKQMFSSLKAIFGIGIGYEFDETGKQRVKIEPLSYFYGDQEILTIEHCSDYSEETAKEFIFSDLVVGYSKYPEEGQYLLDEVNTELEFITPIKTNKNRLELKSGYIGSSFAIEDTRREQFAQKQKDSTTYDDDVFIIAVVNDAGTWKSERLQNYDIKDVIDPGSSYNVGISPKRNLLRSAKWINSGLFYRKGFEIIRNTLFKNNGEAKTKANNESEYIQEKSDITLNNFDNRQMIFKPVWISFKCRLSFSQIQEIKSAHIQKGHLKKNGFITVRNRDGVWKSGYVFEMTFNPTREEVTFKLLEKATNQNGVSCSDYADWTAEDFERASLPSWIEQCIFANFK